MFTLKDLKKLTVSTPVSCMESIKVNGKMIEVSPFNYIRISISKTNELVVKVGEDCEEIERTILSAIVPSKLTLAFNAYCRLIREQLNKFSLTEDEEGLYKILGLTLNIHNASKEEYALIDFYVQSYDEYIDLDEVLSIILNRIGAPFLSHSE